MGDPDDIVRGVAAEAVEKARGQGLDHLLEDAIGQIRNPLFQQTARAVLERRKGGHQLRDQALKVQAKAGTEEFLRKNKDFLSGNLGLIYALAIGGEPVLDFRSIPGKTGLEGVRLTFNPATRSGSTDLIRFNPYEDLRSP